ncbi:uncharacterized protein LOC142644094 [Castanea sativa]|uniref:uncharacterized protein LOC142644094 n=1 Tax=Castanea sativa TaxID=21020 RepID=UPI003F64BA63
MEGDKKINERINKVDEMIRRARKMEDLMDYQSFSLFLDVRLPPKFKMPTLDKFDGTSCPKSHLKLYMRAIQPLGATKELLDQMLQNTLTGAALRWFLNLDNARVRSWEDICCEFHNQYNYNIEVDVTRRDLETTKQESKESFSTFITKWRSEAAQMLNRPSEEEQLTMVVKNLLLVYHKYLCAQYFPNFKALIAIGTQIEDAINNGTIKNEEKLRSISRKLTISYSDKDLTKKGKHHNNPLHITVDAKGKRIPMVLIDNGSALNVCPLKTASSLGLSIEDFVPTDQHVRAYDNSRKEVLGTVIAHYRANDQEGGVSSL